VIRNVVISSPLIALDQIRKALVPTIASFSKPATRLAKRSMKVSSSASGTDAVDVAVVFGDFAGEVIGADQDFERSAAADKARQARHGAAAGDCAAADFELTENDSLLTGETDITGEDKFAARATGAAAKRRNR